MCIHTWTKCDRDSDNREETEDWPDNGSAEAGLGSKAASEACLRPGYVRRPVLGWRRIPGLASRAVPRSPPVVLHALRHSFILTATHPPWCVARCQTIQEQFPFVRFGQLSRCVVRSRPPRAFLEFVFPYYLTTVMNSSITLDSSSGLRNVLWRIVLPGLD